MTPMASRACSIAVRPRPVKSTWIAVNAVAFVIEKRDVAIVERDGDVSRSGQPIDAFEPAVKRCCVDCCGNVMMGRRRHALVSTRWPVPWGYVEKRSTARERVTN
jgi:hypothetical protein